MADVKGIACGYSDARCNFIWKYICAECGRKFAETCPEVSVPALCHTCYTGARNPRGVRVVQCRRLRGGHRNEDD